MILNTSEYSASSMLSDSPIRCATGLSGLSLNFRRERKVCGELVVHEVCSFRLQYANIPVFASSINLLFPPDYRIVIICSNEEEGKSHVISKLQFYRRPYSALPPDASFAEYLLGHFRRWPESAFKKGLSRATVASVVDRDK